MMLEYGNIVKVKSKASYKYYNKFGKVLRKCNSEWCSMYEIYFDETNTKARFCESSLERVR